MNNNTPLEIEQINERDRDLPLHSKGTSDKLYINGKPLTDEQWDKRLEEPFYCECQGLSAFCDKCREVERQEMSR